MSIATKSISSYLPIRARTNRTRSWMALRTPYRWSACATTATSPNQDGVLGEFVGSTWMWTTGSVIFLSSLSHSFSLRKTHFCRLCQFFRAFFPSSAHSLRIPWDPSGVTICFVEHPVIQFAKDFLGHNSAKVVRPSANDRIELCQNQLHIGPSCFVPLVLKLLLHLLD